MKRFLIKYRRQNTPQDAWHRDIAEFIAALDADPALQGKILVLLHEEPRRRRLLSD